MENRINKAMRPLIILFFIIIFPISIFAGERAKYLFVVQTEFLGMQERYYYGENHYKIKNPFLIGVRTHGYKKYTEKKLLVPFEWQMNYRLFIMPNKYRVDNYLRGENIKALHIVETFFGIRFYPPKNFKIIKNHLYIKPTGAIAFGISTDFTNFNLNLESLVSAGINLSAGDYNSGFSIEVVMRPITQLLLPHYEVVFAPSWGLRIAYRFSKR